jgi:hypothetical protein
MPSTAPGSGNTTVKETERERERENFSRGLTF